MGEELRARLNPSQGHPPLRTVHYCDGTSSVPEGLNPSQGHPPLRTSLTWENGDMESYVLIPLRVTRLFVPGQGAAPNSRWD